MRNPNRTYNGSVISALFPWIPLPFSVEEVEALASRRAVLFVKEIRIFEAIFEGDAKLIIRALL